MKKPILLLVVISMSLLFTGCMGALFNRVSLTSNRHITVGQELMDLKEAHEKGIINDSEYAEAKKKIMNTLSVYEDFESQMKSSKK